MAHVPPPPQPILVDPNNEEIQKRLSREFITAQSKALRSNISSTGHFVVGWEMHHGYYLIRANAPGVQITPDFLDAHVVALFDAEQRNDVLAKHIGEKLICECYGIQWAFYSDRRFLVQSAKFRWMR